MSRNGLASVYSLNKLAPTSATSVPVAGAGRQAQGRVTRKEKCSSIMLKEIHMSPLTEYISILDFPGRILNQPASTAYDYEVALIELRRLRRLGRVLERRTDVQQMLAIKEHINYVTSSHILVHSLIPQSCILGFLSKIELAPCVTKGILSLTISQINSLSLCNSTISMYSDESPHRTETLE